jgi:hypothetical protein
MSSDNNKKIYNCSLCNKNILHKRIHLKTKGHIKHLNAEKIKEKYFVISTEEYELIKNKLDNLLIEIRELKNKD